MRFGTGILNYLSYFLIGVATVTVLSGFITDVTLYSDKFMDDSEIKSVSRLDNGRDRFVASENRGNLGHEYLPMDEAGINESMINGVWEVYSFINESEELIEKQIRVNLELFGTSQIKVSQTKGFEDRDIFEKSTSVNYYLQIMSSETEIVLVKSVRDNGLREIKARKIVVDAQKKKLMKPIVVNSQLASKDVEAVDSKVISGVESGNYIEEESVELVIKNVYHPQKSSKLIEGDDISGTVTIVREIATDAEGNVVSKNIVRVEDLNVTINYGRDNCSIEISSMNVFNGNTFRDVPLRDCVSGEQAESHGLVVENGKQDGSESEYSLLISTGPYQGAALRFATLANDVNQKALVSDQVSEKEEFEQSGFDFDKVQESREQVVEEDLADHADAEELANESEKAPQVVKSLEIKSRKNVSFEEMAEHVGEAI